jgi:CPA2 family monovalent cation:H+ antiporter-2
MTGLALTLLVALAAALALGAIAHRLHLPPMLGYIGAGMVVGPFTPGFVADREEVLALADIGVALLMFSIGLQFSIGELRSVGARILAGTPVQVAITMAIGTLTGLALGWELLEALFIGGRCQCARRSSSSRWPASRRSTPPRTGARRSASRSCRTC